MRFTDVVARLTTGLRQTLPGAEAQARLAPVPRREWPAGFNAARVRDAAGLLLVFPKDDSEKTGEIAESAENRQRKNISLRSLRSPRFLPDRDETEKTGENAETAEKNDSLRSLRSPRFLPDRDRDQAYLILTVRAGTLGRHGGQVSLPGGVVEPGETFEQAALREAHEEIGLSLDTVRVIGALTPLDIPVSGFRLHPIVAVSDTRPVLSPADGEVARILEVALDDLLDAAHLRRTVRERDGVSLTIPAFHVADEEIWGATAMVLAECLAMLGWRGDAPT